MISGPQPGAIPGFATFCRFQLTRVGFEPNLTSLKDWQRHQKSNGPYLCTHDLRDPGPPGKIVEYGLEGARILLSWFSTRR